MLPPLQELQIETSAEGKAIKRRWKMEEHEAPLIFEEVFVKTRGSNQVISGTKIKMNGELA